MMKLMVCNSFSVRKIVEQVCEYGPCSRIQQILQLVFDRETLLTVIVPIKLHQNKTIISGPNTKYIIDNYSGVQNAGRRYAGQTRITAFPFGRYMRHGLSTITSILAGMQDMAGM